MIPGAAVRHAPRRGPTDGSSIGWAPDSPTPKATPLTCGPFGNALTVCARGHVRAVALRDVRFDGDPAAARIRPRDREPKGRIGDELHRKQRLKDVAAPIGTGVDHAFERI
jgi:hypothetical protein